VRFRDKTLLVGIVSALAIWFVWAAIDPIPIVEDEYSYVLQSRIFASGHWTAPSPPAPDFFQQPHVLTIPAVASKFPPGHALLLSLGTLIGARALVPLILTGLTGALIFVLVCRITNVWTAALTWLVWLGDPINLRFRAAYYSEVTTSALWLVSWWALFRWRRDRRRRWLLALAAAIGWAAITRPLTTLAFAVPVGVIVIRDVARLKLWRDFGFAVGLGTAILGIIPLWSAETTGNWRVSPLTLYTRDYLPYDKPGFGVDSTPPARVLQPVNKETYYGFFDEHVKHTPSNLPRIVLERLQVIAHDQWSGPRLALVPFVVIGLFAMNAEAVFALVCSLALFVAYLSYGHWSHWTLYYFEAMPVLSLLAGLGLWRVIGWARAPCADRRIVRLAVSACVVVALLAAFELETWRGKRRQMAEWDVTIRALIDRLPMPAAVIFVHYAPRIGPHARIVTNSPHLSDDPVWIVNDLGPRDSELMRYAGPRIPLAFQEDAGTFEIDRKLLRLSP
jgi:hypothetical protein